MTEPIDIMAVALDQAEQAISRQPAQSLAAFARAEADLWRACRSLNAARRVAEFLEAAE